MHLCILANSIATEISQITLRDGHIPSIRGHQHQGRNGSPDLPLEPSVWFKVLVVDVVVVNCSQRQLSWEISSIDDGVANCSEQVEDVSFLQIDGKRNGRVRNPVRRSSARKPDAMSAEDSFDLDEIFDSLPGLVTDYERNAITASQFHGSLMKFMHLYILPSIVLTSKHMASMRQGVDQQERFLQKVNEDIDSTSLKLEAVMRSKKKLRHRFISDINSSSQGDLPYSRSLVDTLLKDIFDEILDVSKDLEVAQDGVDRTKKNLVTRTDSTADDLMAVRKTRDEVVQQYEGLLNARENIQVTKNDMEATHGRRPRAPRKSDKPEHRIYEELTSIEENLIAVMKSLSEKKLLILSVKEAMKLTMAELETGADSYGVDVETNGYLKATDLLDNGSVVRPVWMTLSEQVAEILANPSHSVTKRHLDFCNSVVERCRAAVGERTVYEKTMARLSGDKSTSKTTRHNAQGDYRSSSSSAKGAKTIFCEDLTTDCCKVVVPVEGQQNGTNHPSSPPSPSSPQNKNNGGSPLWRNGQRSDVELSRLKRRNSESKTLYMLDSFTDDAVLVFEEDTNYTRKAINTLQKDIRRHFELVTEQLRVELRQKSTTSLWLSYESHFYDKVIDYILTLYALEYGGVTTALGQTIRSLQATDLSFQDSIMVKMLQEAEDSVEYNTTTARSMQDARSDVQLSPKTKAEVDQFELNQPNSETLFARLSSAANPEVDVEEFLPRLREVSESEIVITDSKIPSHSSVSKLRKSSASELQSSTRSVRKSIRVAYPFSTVIVYDRTICPDQNTVAVETRSAKGTSRLFEGTITSTVFGRDRKQELRPVKTMMMRPEYKRQFQQAFNYISVAVETRCLATKFQQLTRCLRETSRQISAFCEAVRGFTGVATCCDELMDGVILLLCNLDETVLSQLHIEIMMLSDLMPPFFECNSFNFTLVQFVGAFQFLKDTILMKRQQTSSAVVPHP